MPDRTTVDFRELDREPGAKAVFNGVSEQLFKKPFIAWRPDHRRNAGAGAQAAQWLQREGTDRIGRKPASWRPEKRRHKGVGATWIKKHGKSHFGYKLSINVDKKHKIIRRIETDTASTHDCQHFDNVFDTSNTSRDVYADRGYPSEEREDWLKANEYRNQIQRKGKRNKPLSECQQQRNKRIARTRARVEYVFGAIEQMGGKLLRTIGQTRANFAMTMMAACYNLKRLVYFGKSGMGAS